MKEISAENGKKGGRPKIENNCLPDFKIPNINMVIITENQYNKLIEKYGDNIVIKALAILDNWLEKSPIGSKYRGKNNYAHFRSDGWLIYEAKYCNE